MWSLGRPFLIDPVIGGQAQEGRAGRFPADASHEGYAAGISFHNGVQGL